MHSIVLRCFIRQLLVKLCHFASCLDHSVVFNEPFVCELHQFLPWHIIYHSGIYSHNFVSYSFFGHIQYTGQNSWIFFGI